MTAESGKHVLNAAVAAKTSNAITTTGTRIQHSATPRPAVIGRNLDKKTVLVEYFTDFLSTTAQTTDAAPRVRGGTIHQPVNAASIRSDCAICIKH
jgi:hypothetical protein